MKMFLILAISLLAVFSTSAQSEKADTGSLKVMVVNPKGKPVRSSGVFFKTSATPSAIPMGDKGTTVIPVIQPDDTLTIVTLRSIYDVPVSGLDSLVLQMRAREFLPVEKDPTLNAGYYTISKRDNTLPVSQISMKGIESYTDLASYLSGRVAGLSIVRDASGSKAIIRGINSIHSEIGALIVVDGMEMASFDAVNSSINIRDIQSVDVLKDGSMYGVRGANGVIIITTRRGAK